MTRDKKVKYVAIHQIVLILIINTSTKDTVPCSSENLVQALFWKNVFQPLKEILGLLLASQLFLTDQLIVRGLHSYLNTKMNRDIILTICCMNRFTSEEPALFSTQK